MLTDNQTFEKTKKIINARIIIYNDQKSQNAIKQVAKVYLNLLSNDNDNTVNISKQN